MSIHTILGAGGIIANGLAKLLLSHNIPVRLVSRHPQAIGSAATLAADITDPAQALTAITGSDIVYCCIGLAYNYNTWRRQWPAIMDNIISACSQTGARLIFFDNVYMYGKVDGPMTEETPYDPSSRKGDLRARLATQLMSEVRRGNITASIARAADFYGPGAGKTGILNLLVFSRLIKDKPAQWLGNPNAIHSFTYTADAVNGLYLLGQHEHAWNQAWHLPTAPVPPTGRVYIEMAAAALGKQPRLTLLPEWMLTLGGLFDATTRELPEMLYQYKYEYLFDSTKFERAFDYQPVSYEQGIIATANAYRNGTGF